MSNVVRTVGEGDGGLVELQLCGEVGHLRLEAREVRRGGGAGLGSGAPVHPAAPRTQPFLQRVRIPLAHLTHHHHHHHNAAQTPRAKRSPAMPTDDHRAPTYGLASLGGGAVGDALGPEEEGVGLRVVELLWQHHHRLVHHHLHLRHTALGQSSYVRRHGGRWGLE